MRECDMRVLAGRSMHGPGRQLCARQVRNARENLKRIIRLGKREQNTCRPLLVELVDHGTKNEVMENVSKLGRYDTRFKDIVVAHDMTLKEWQQCKAVVREVKRKEFEENAIGQPWDWIYRVRGLPGQMKTVKIKKRYQKDLNNKTSVTGNIINNSQIDRLSVIYTNADTF